MTDSWNEFVDLVREQANHDMDNGDFVTLYRDRVGLLTVEKVLTFSGLILMRESVTYACYAASEESEEDLGQAHEEYGV